MFFTCCIAFMFMYKAQLILIFFYESVFLVCLTCVYKYWIKKRTRHETANIWPVKDMTALMRRHLNCSQGVKRSTYSEILKRHKLGTETSLTLLSQHISCIHCHWNKSFLKLITFSHVTSHQAVDNHVTSFKIWNDEETSELVSPSNNSRINVIASKISFKG